MNRTVKVTSISDTHGLHRSVDIEKTDILLFAGDAMTSGYDYNNLLDFLDWFSSRPAKHKIMIAGNHCRYLENYPEKFEAIMLDYPSVVYLKDSFTIVEGLKIYGTPHSKVFFNWAFNSSEAKLEELFDMIPMDTHILLSHAPQWGVLDELVDGKNVGEVTLHRIIKKMPNLKLHVFGHIHNSFGMIKPDKQHISINASQVDEEYNITNFPITVKIKIDDNNAR